MGVSRKLSYITSVQVKNPSGIMDEAAHIFIDSRKKYFILEPLEELGKHVLSFWVKSTTSNSIIIKYDNTQQEFPVTQDWKKVVFKFNAENLINIWIYFPGTEYWMYNTQLELGDFATDYSRNPKDTQKDIDDTKKQVEEYRKETSAEILITQESITQKVTAEIDQTRKYAESIAKSITDQSLNDFVSAVYDPTIAGLQHQIDGQIETWYYDYEPTLSDLPASDWKTEAERARHEGDLFYWKSKGFAYRFFRDGSTWKWQMVQDTDITKALAEAAQAQDTADSKRRVFINTPYPPYDVGDLWSQGINGDIMRCIKARASGGYDPADWDLASKYVDSDYVGTQVTTTKVELESKIEQTQAGILSTVSATYATITYTDAKADTAQSNAIADTTNKLKNYSTTTEMNTAIDQRADSITSTVNVKIEETKTYADTAASTAQANAIADTEKKLENYSTTKQMQSQILQTQENILQTVSVMIDGVETSVASVELTANKINWLVKSGTSASNFTLTDRTASLVASYININGLVEFSGLNESTQTVINNATSTAQTAKSKVDSWSAAKNTTLIDGGKIYTGSITADKLKVNDLSALGATLGGWTVDAYGISAKQLPRREILLHRWDDPNQPFPYIFYFYDQDTASEFYIAPDGHVRIMSPNSPALSVSGKSSFDNVSASSVSATGEISGNSVSSVGKISGGSIEITGNVTIGSNSSSKVSIGGLYGNISINAKYAKLGFFGETGSTKQTVTAFTSYDSITETELKEKINSIIKALKAYNLV